MSDEKVLVFGDDGSPGADAAWAWVCAQRWSGWRAEVITAEMPPIGPPPDSADATLHEWEPPSWRHAPDACGFSEIVHLRADADPRYVLETQVDASVVVVGRARKGLLKAVHLGSTAEHLMHNPPAPLVIARGDGRVRRVLVAVDGSPHAQAAVEALAAMPWTGALDSVELVTVGDDHGKASAGLERARAALGAMAVETTALPGSESIARAIMARAATIDANLIVVGTRGIGPIKRMLAGSTATAIAEHAPCSVLMAHVDDPN